MNLNPRRWFSRILLSGAVLLTTMASPAAAQSLQIPIPIPGLGNLPVNIPIPIPGLSNGYNNSGYYDPGYNGGYYNPGYNGGYYNPGYSNGPALNLPIPGVGNVGIPIPMPGQGGGYGPGYAPGYGPGGYDDPGYYQPGYDGGYYEPGYRDPGYRGNGRQRNGRSRGGYSRGHDHDDHQRGPVGPGAPSDYGVIREGGQFVRVADEDLPVRVYSNDQRFDDVMRHAIAEWNSAGAGQLFAQVSTPEQADYTVDWSGRGLPREAAGVCVMEPGRDGLRVTGLTIDTRRRNVPRGNLTEVLLQEMGHSLGLNHSDNPEDIMYDTMHEQALRNVTDARITQRDKQMITWLYSQTDFVPILSQASSRAAYRR